MAQGTRLARAIDALPEAVWNQIEQNKRYDALFEHQPMAAGAGMERS